MIIARTENLRFRKRRIALFVPSRRTDTYRHSLAAAGAEGAARTPAAAEAVMAEAAKDFKII